MRYRRHSFLVGWVAVGLLAAVGFAAFGSPDPSLDEVRSEAAAASIGHTAGAYAGVTFALLGGSAGTRITSDPFSTGASVDLETLEAIANQRPEIESSDPESTAPITSSVLGWLSEVEVRALVSLYFKPEDVNRAVRIAWCTSRFDPNSVDRRTGGMGLFHHLPKYWEERATKAGFPGASPTDPEANVAAAAWTVYEGGGWDVFACTG